MSDRLGRRDIPLPKMPSPDAKARYPAVEALDVILSRKLICRRWAAGLTQAELARRARIRPEALNRIDKRKHAPSVRTVERILRALEQAEQEADEQES